MLAKPDGLDYSLNPDITKPGTAMRPLRSGLTWLFCFTLSLSGAPAFGQLDITLGPACGNSILDAGEQCDDGNAQAGDGCSDNCQVEGGYSCSDPVPADLTNLVADPGFEAGPFGGVWSESSDTLGTPICSEEDCELAGQRSGLHWAWFGGISFVDEEAIVSQVISVPESASQLSFWLRMPLCNTAGDYIEVLVGDTQAWVKTGGDALCDGAEYVQQVIDITAWADGNEHEISFHSETFSSDENYSDFFIDDVELIRGPAQPIPGMCSIIEENIFSDGFESVP